MTQTLLLPPVTAILRAKVFAIGVDRIRFDQDKQLHPIHLHQWLFHLHRPTNMYHLIDKSTLRGKKYNPTNELTHGSRRPCHPRRCTTMTKCSPRLISHPMYHTFVKSHEGLIVRIRIPEIPVPNCRLTN